MTLRLLPDAEDRLRAGEDGVLLFSYETDEGAVATLSTAPSLAAITHAHFTQSAAPLSPASLAALDACIRPHLAKWSYAPDRGNGDVYRIFRADPALFSPKTTKLSTVPIKSVDNYQNLTTLDLPAALRAGCVAYGYIEGGRILSLAITHTPPTGAAVELTLETAREYRGRGYGGAALAAITADLVGRGVAVLYRTRRNNTPSARAALSCGFRAAGLYYRYLGRRV